MSCCLGSVRPWRKLAATVTEIATAQTRRAIEMGVCPTQAEISCDAPAVGRYAPRYRAHQFSDKLRFAAKAEVEITSAIRRYSMMENVLL